jgi:serine protease
MRTVRLLPFILIVILAGCRPQQEAQLTVTPGPPLSAGEISTSLGVSNTGGSKSLLEWQAVSSHDEVSLEPSSGLLAGGESVSVSVTGLNGRPLPFNTRITVSSASASRTVHLASPDAYYCLSGSAAASSSAPDGPAFAPGQLLVRYKDPPALLPAGLEAGFFELQSQGLRSTYQLEVLSAGGAGRPELVAVSGSPQEAARELELDPRVLYAEPNYYLHPLGCREELWHLDRFGIPEAWRQREGTHGVVVAVIDSGVDIDHPELSGSMLPGYRFLHLTEDNVHYDLDSSDPRPGSGNQAGHGTHVAGIIAALGAGSEGVSGAAPFPAVGILPVRIFDDDGKDATMSDLIRAVNWALGLYSAPGIPENPHPARIINLSLGMAGRSSRAMNELMLNARNRDVLVIASAGNRKDGQPLQGVYTPANSPHVLAVGSVDADYGRSDFSEYGGAFGIALMAGGGSGPSRCLGVLSTLPDGRFGCMQGTSMAAPFVAAVAALVLTREPELTVAQLAGRLTGATYYDPAFMTPEEYGHGVLCAERAVMNLNPAADRPCSSG